MNRLTKVKFTNLEKVLYPELEIKKRDIVKYFILIAPRILKFLKDRALVRTRYPGGIYGSGFYEKDAPKGKPEWVKTYNKYSKSAGKYTRYVVCNDLDTLLWLANLVALELHIPLSRIPETSKPDFVLFDIDPEPPAGLPESVRAALLLKEKLESLGFDSFVKTSGKKGLHVIIPVKPEYEFQQTREFAHLIGIELARESGFIVSERSQTRDPGTVLIDYPQNSERATMIAPFSLRPLREATVSTPLEWRELTSIRPFDWNIYSIVDRKEEPWKDLWDKDQKLKL